MLISLVTETDEVNEELNCVYDECEPSKNYICYHIAAARVNISDENIRHCLLEQGCYGLEVIMTAICCVRDLEFMHYLMRPWQALKQHKSYKASRDMEYMEPNVCHQFRLSAKQDEAEKEHHYLDC